MSEFDVVIVGSGPSAIGALLGLNRDNSTAKRVAVVTGTANHSSGQETWSAGIHSKVRNELFESSSWHSICNLIPLTEQKRKLALFETACVGGLATFWGQQLVRHSPADFQPAAVADSYEKYRNACDLIEHHVGFKERDAGQHAFVVDGCEAIVKSPRLLEPLDAMREAFHRASRDSKIIDQRVVRLFRASDGRITVVCEDGQSLTADQTILAAGVLGTARILSSSVPSVKGCRFSDHTPYFFHTLARKNPLIRRFGGLTRNMNFLNLEVTRSGSVQIFGSVYCATRMAANLALGELGVSPLRILAGRQLTVPLPYYPIQIWTKDSIVEVELERVGQETRARTLPRRADTQLDLARQMIGTCGFKIFHANMTHTPAGFGFHHHNLRISEDGLTYEPAGDFVHRHFGATLTIVDGSVLREVTPRPHTETLMANALCSARATGRVG